MEERGHDTPHVFVRDDRIGITFAPSVLIAHRASSYHRKAVEASAQCGCFCCECLFAPSEIKEWIDGGQTALCPRCGIDAVLGSPWSVSPDFLAAMRKHWFLTFSSSRPR